MCVCVCTRTSVHACVFVFVCVHVHIIKSAFISILHLLQTDFFLQSSICVFSHCS